MGGWAGGAGRHRLFPNRRSESRIASRHLVDPEVAPALDLLPDMQCTDAGLVAMRAQLAGMYALISAHSEIDASIERAEHYTNGGPDGSPPVRMLVYAPRDGAAGRPAYLYIHGGGFIMGTADMAERVNIALAIALDCVVVAVDYQIAPETTFPGNIQDCYAALAWLHHNAVMLGVSPNRIAIGGESAGGGLAAAFSAAGA